MEYLSDEDFKVAAEKGLSHNVVYQRFYVRGWSKKRTLNTPKMPGKGDGLWPKYKNISVVCMNTFYQRVNDGVDPHTAATARRTTFRKRVITEEQYALAAKNGIVRSTAYARVYNLGWSVEKAISVPIEERFRRKAR